MVSRSLESLTPASNMFCSLPRTGGHRYKILFQEVYTDPQLHLGMRPVFSRELVPSSLRGLLAFVLLLIISHYILHMRPVSQQP